LPPTRRAGRVRSKNTLRGRAHIKEARMDKSIRLSKNVSAPKNRILKQLEEFATVPDAKYGDSFRRIERQFPDLLKSMRLPAEREDVRAAVILSRSQVDINAKNLSIIKELDSKLASISDGLHPRLAVSLLTEGINPLEITIDELLAYINNFSGKSSKSGLSSDILEIVKKLEPVMRNAVISLYKALNIIMRNNNGATLGFALKSRNIDTLGALLSMESNVNDNIDFIIDQAFIHERTAQENSIKTEIERACANSKALLTT